MYVKKLIGTEEEYREAMARIKEIFHAPAGTSESDELELRVRLVEMYEKERYPIDPPDPISAIEFRIEQQRLTQRDLIPYFGSRSKVSEVLSGKRAISMSMARALHRHLGISAEALLQEPGATFEESAEIKEAERFPFAEIVKRGWIKRNFKSHKDDAEDIVQALREMAGGPEVGLNALYRRNEHRRLNPKTDRFALQAWCWRVLALANENPMPNPYREQSVDRKFLREVANLSSSENGPRLAREVLAENGIALVVERHLPKTHLDGATLWGIDGRPVIGMTLRYDRLDNFWFTLLHELAHVGRHEKKNENDFIDDMSLRKKNREDNNLIESEADDWAEEALIPKTIWESSQVYRSPRPMNVINLANELNVHPAVVAGRVRYDRDNYRLLSQFVGNGEVWRHFKDAELEQSRPRSKS